jgi:hypothetical protein
MGRCHHHHMAAGSGSTPSRKHPDQQQSVPTSKEGDPGDGEPRPPGPPAGLLSTLALSAATPGCCRLAWQSLATTQAPSALDSGDGRAAAVFPGGAASRQGGGALLELRRLLPGGLRLADLQHYRSWATCSETKGRHGQDSLRSGTFPVRLDGSSGSGAGTVRPEAGDEAALPGRLHSA